MGASGIMMSPPAKKNPELVQQQQQQIQNLDYSQEDHSQNHIQRQQTTDSAQTGECVTLDFFFFTSGSSASSFLSLTSSFSLCPPVPLPYPTLLSLVASISLLPFQFLLKVSPPPPPESNLRVSLRV